MTLFNMKLYFFSSNLVMSNNFFVKITKFMEKIIMQENGHQLL
jgi:hypothetical protein